MDDTWNLSMFDDELPYWLPLEELLPVIVPDVLPLVPVGFVLVGLLGGFGLVSSGELEDFSIVPFTSTR
jgi:hypothetical protein